MSSADTTAMLEADRSKWPSVAIVVLNWNNYEDTAECLRSVRDINYLEYDVIVVDNGSTDNSGERLRDEFEWCEFVFNDENRGFAGGVNTAIEGRISQYGYFLIFNNDMVMDNDTLALLVSAAENSSSVGIVSPKTVYHDRDEIQTGERKFNEYSLAFENVHEGLPPDQVSGVKLVEAVSGGCMLIDSGMIQEIGLLSEKFFFGGEDVEYCLRARRKDWKIALQANTSVEHKPHSTTGSDNRFTQYHSTKNRIRLGLKSGYLGKIGILRKFVADATRVVGFPFLGRSEEAIAITLAYLDIVLQQERKRTELL